MIQQFNHFINEHTIIAAFIFLVGPVLLAVLVHILAFTIMVGIYYFLLYLAFAKAHGGWGTVLLAIAVPLGILLFAVLV
jgi:hypothetical protein